MLIDTHTHLYLSEFDADGGGHEAVRRALAAGVGHMIFPNVDLTTIEPMRSLAAEYAKNISMTMGLHPSEVNETWSEATSTVLAECDNNSNDYIGIGEIGMDMYWDKTYESQQMQAFERQVDYAAAHSLPIIIHCREALDQTLEVLTGKKVTGVFHSFGGSFDDVERIRRVGDYYFGINGIVTFKNCKVRDVLPTIGPDRLLLETDSPYLAPVPMRGKRNESAYIVHTANHIAEHMNLTLQQLIDITGANAKRLFPRMKIS